jgi:hypothetical protein
MTTGTCSYRLGKDDAKLAEKVGDASTNAGDGHELTDQKIVDTIIDAVRGRGVPFNLMLGCSHVIFKTGHPPEQDILDVRKDVEAARIILDPLEPSSLLSAWLALNVIALCSVPCGRSEQAAQRLGEEPRRIVAARHHVSVPQAWPRRMAFTLARV